MNFTKEKIAEEKKHLRSCIQRVCTGPEYSKNLPYGDAKRAMDFILSGHADPVQISVLLVGLRMKRETDDENKGFLQSILDHTSMVNVDVENVVDIADAYNGQVRGLPAIPFLPTVLAACGVNAVSHGVKSVGPKFGITTSQVLAAAGIDVNLSTADAAKRLEDNNIGWAYVDQQAYCKPLHDLIPLRTIIVKRTLLTTLECIIGPIRGKSTTLLTGYVHKAYPPVYSSLARLAKFDNAIIARGVEGGVIPSLQQMAKIHYFNDMDEDQVTEVSTEILGMSHNSRATVLPKDLPVANDIFAEDKPPFDLDVAVKATLDAGMAALEGKEGTTKDALIYISAITLVRLGKAEDLKSGAKIAREAIDSGTALKCFV